MKNKKASMSPAKMGIYIIYSFLIVIALGTFITTLNRASASINVLDEDVEKFIIQNRIILSSECFAYSDWTGRTYAAIDIDRFSSKILGHCINLDSYNFEIRFILSYSEITDNIEAVTSNWFGDYSYESFNMPVIVRDSGKNYLGNLVVDYQTSLRR